MRIVSASIFPTSTSELIPMLRFSSPSDVVARMDSALNAEDNIERTQNI
jgi:hypothetical protein